MYTVFTICRRETDNMELVYYTNEYKIRFFYDMDGTNVLAYQSIYKYKRKLTRANIKKLCDDAVIWNFELYEIKNIYLNN